VFAFIVAVALRVGVAGWRCGLALRVGVAGCRGGRWALGAERARHGTARDRAETARDRMSRSD